ncbi:MAG: BatD family protein [Candidatus Hydrogenedentes bacterium]|nr:BatD family protein [Candidatus Hydrogenedentota bacterium]
MRHAACIAAALLMAAMAWAEPEVRASVDRNTVTVRRPFLFTIQITGNDIGAISIPDVDGLNINKRADHSGSSTQVEFNAGRSVIARTQSFGYYAQAIRPGRFTIPAIQVQVDGKTLSTQPIPINVLDSGAAPQAQPGNAPAAQPAQPQAAQQAPGQPTWEDAVFIQSAVDKHEAFQGEPVSLTLSLWCLDVSGLQVSSFTGANIKYPTSEGFYAVTADPQRVSKQHGNWNYTVTEFRQILYPTATGDLTIGPWHWEGAGMYGFQRQNFALDTQPIAVKVIYVSDPEKDAQQVQSPSGPSVEKTFTYTLTPLEPGILQIPEISYCYFDPADGTYKTEKTAPFTVTVLKSVESGQARTLVTENAPVDKGKVEVIGEDILPIVTNPGPLYPHRSSPVNTGAAAVFPVVACGAISAYTRRKRRFEQDKGLARSHGAKSRFHKRLKSIGQAPEPADELYHALTGFIADKFNVVESGMTSADVRQAYESRGVGPEETEQVVKILRACERSRYASVKLSVQEVQALADAAVQALERLDETLKKERRA